ncbi:Carnitine O-palmitoyltransferase 2, mitochondrial [Desmophyllum pertusum]|uniref:Carnitine O-palmitoyltransferase 2, mitochondrial n=1 Tax=Desmophyllum pertusum TaxID=174260 RepID=A0A9W9ZIX0_9CNID|nr:Carnitine O-palmitoyltransferase 2, mitochondrial [Desmophyllum pertusum]
MPDCSASTRIPELKKDRLATFESGRHILVMRKGNFYVFDTITTDGHISSTATILSKPENISLTTHTFPPNFPVAALTSENRDTWASMRHALEVIPGNEEILRLIDSAVFALSLDDHELNSVAACYKNISTR